MSLIDANAFKDHRIKMEYEIARSAIEANGFNQSKAAKSLGIDRKTIYNILKRHTELQRRESKG